MFDLNTQAKTPQALRASSPIKGSRDFSAPSGQLPQKGSQEAEETTLQLGRYVEQLGRIVAAMQRRMDEMERESQRRVTISHAQVLALQKRIRQRAAAICAQYALSDPADERAFRAVIKKDVLRRYGIRDLHDLPLAALDLAEQQADGYSNFALVVKRRREAEEPPKEEPGPLIITAKRKGRKVIEGQKMFDLSGGSL